MSYQREMIKKLGNLIPENKENIVTIRCVYGRKQEIPTFHWFSDLEFKCLKCGYKKLKTDFNFEILSYTYFKCSCCDTYYKLWPGTNQPYSNDREFVLKETSKKTVFEDLLGEGKSRHTYKLEEL